MNRFLPANGSPTRRMQRQQLLAQDLLVRICVDQKDISGDSKRRKKGKEKILGRTEDNDNGNVK
jgi:hypothetical protein